MLSIQELIPDSRKRTIALTAAAALGLILVCFIGLVIYLKRIDFNTYKPELQQAVQQATGRTLGIDGQLALSVSMHPSLVVEGLHLSNATGGSRADMASIERMQVELSLWSLLFGEIDVKRLVLIRPDILLETLPDGGNNWDLAAPGSAVGESGSGVPAEAQTESDATDEAVTSLPQVHDVLIRDAVFAYRDAASRSVQRLAIPELRIWQEGDRTDAPLHLDVSASLDKLPLKLSGTVGSVGLLLDNEPLPLDLKLSTAGVEMLVKGSVDKPLAGSGLALSVRLDALGLGGLAKELGLSPALDVPLHMQGELKDEDGGYALRAMSVAFGESDVAGDILFAETDGRPKVDVKLDSKKVSLIGLLPEKKDAEKPAAKASGSAKPAGDKKPARVLPSDPLPLDALRDIDIDARWTMKQFVAPDLKLSNVTVALTLDRGVLRMPLDAGLAGGSLHSDLALRADKAPARLDVRIKGKGIVAGRLLDEGSDGLMQGGSTDIDVRLKGSGRSVAALMASSNGRIKVKMGEGQVKSGALEAVGGDIVMGLVDKLNPFSEKKDTMKLQCGVVHFRVDNGVMRSEDGIAFETERMNILSEGTIDLRDESIDLSIGTEPREGLGVNLSNLVNVVKLGGTLAEPGIEVDAAKTGMAAARTAGAVMTGGLSLLGEGLINRATADSSPCKTALEMK